MLAASRGASVLVLGDMGEVGAQGSQFHREVGAFARSCGVTRLLALGDATAETVRAFGAGGTHFSSVQELAASLDPLLGAGVTVLVKGSRFMRMERVVEALLAGAAGSPGKG